MSSSRQSQHQGSPSSESKTPQQTTYRYLNTQISSNQKWSHSPYTAKTPTRSTTFLNKQRNHILESINARQALQTPSVLPVSIDPKVSHPSQTTSESLLSITEIQHLKLRTIYLEQQLTISRQQTEQIIKQKKILNENYVQLINKQIESEEQKHQELSKIKLTHAQELNQYSHQLSACSQALSRLQLEVLKKQEELDIQCRLFRQREDGLVGAIGRLELKINQVKSQCHSHVMKLSQCETLLSKKQAQIQELQSEISTQSKNISLHKAEYDSLMNMFNSLQNEHNSLMSENHSLNHTVSQLHNELSQKESNMKKMSQEISVLLKIDHQSHHELALQQQTIHNLQQQYHSLNLSYAELQTSSEQSIQSMRQNEQSLQGEISTLKMLQAKLRQENMTLIKHLENLKDRETLLIESEKNAREKLTSYTEKKNKQIEDLCLQNERLYKEINKIKFSAHSSHSINQVPMMSETQSSFINNFGQSK